MKLRRCEKKRAKKELALDSGMVLTCRCSGKAGSPNLTNARTERLRKETKSLMAHDRGFKKSSGILGVY